MATTPPDGTIRYAKWSARFKRDSQGNLPQGSTVLVERLLESPAIEARIREKLGKYMGAADIVDVEAIDLDKDLQDNPPADTDNDDDSKSQ